MITTLALACALWNYTPPVVVETVKRELSVYSDKYHGRLTADGSIFSQDELTVADFLLFNQFKRGYASKTNRVYVRICLNGQKVIAELTDVTHRDYRHRTDLSREVARKLTGTDWGLWSGATVEVIQWDN